MDSKGGEAGGVGGQKGERGAGGLAACIDSLHAQPLIECPMDGYTPWYVHAKDVVTGKEHQVSRCGCKT